MRCNQVLASIDDLASGPSYSVLGLANALAANGVEVTLSVVKGWRGNSPHGKLDPSIVLNAHNRSSGPLGKLVCGSTSLWHSLCQYGGAGGIFHAHGLWLMPNVYPAWAASKSASKTKLVISPRGMLGAPALEFSKIKKKVFWYTLQRKAVQAAACLHATSGSELADIRAFGLSKPVAVIPNGIEFPDLLARNELVGRPREMLTLGRIHPKKGLDRLIRAWAQLEESFPEWRLRIVGPAEIGYDKELLGIVTSLKLKHVSIEGPIFGNEKQAIYRAADVFVLPTLNENFAMTVAEALVAELPVIATDGAPWSGLETERCGWWIKQGTESLAAALATAMRTPVAELQKMGARGRQWMRRDFRWNSVAEKTLLLYKWILGQGDKPEFVYCT